MRKGLTSNEGLEMIMQPDHSSELQDVLSSPSDTTDSGVSDPDFVVAPSSSSSTSTEGEEDSEDPGPGWIGRNGEVWFSTNVETTPFLQPARGVTPGPTRYAIARLHQSEGQEAKPKKSAILSVIEGYSLRYMPNTVLLDLPTSLYARTRL
ncbi:hypothetical protein DPX16_0035 [Anabarilius grahami]|uniref:Uncharacterized protein n=1 Tax=Anabarilius grahami TaxID=495550 RepID=A0A3N0XSB7_ANAGA|nr:hypothetical protein DPX16_0035 [Anabarilius grahami]